MATSAMTMARLERPIAWWKSRGVQSAVALVVLVALAYAFNQVIVNEIRGADPESTITPLFGFVWSLLFSGVVGAVVVGMTKIGSLLQPGVTWGRLIHAYLIASLWHCISGGWVIYLHLSGGLPEAGQPIVLGLNLFGWESAFGRYLGFLAVDELFHLITYGLLASRLYRWRQWWWLTTALVVPWLLFTWVTSAWRP